MKKYKRSIIILVIVTLIITVFLSYYSYYRYTRLTNAFASNVVEAINTNYPDVDMTTIIDIINSSDYTTSDILTNYGFTENDIKLYIFGSRARGDYRANSDIDIAVMDSISTEKKYKIMNEIDLIDCIYKIDLVFMQDIKNLEFINAIKTDAKQI